MTDTEMLDWILREKPTINPPLYGGPYRIAAWGYRAGEGRTWREAIREAVRIQEQRLVADSTPPSGKKVLDDEQESAQQELEDA